MSPTMPYRHKKIKKRISNSSRAKNQQRCRRRKSLLKKAYEYGVECDADVYVVLRVRDDGQIYTFNSSGQWLPSLQELVSFYPHLVICLNANNIRIKTTRGQSIKPHRILPMNANSRKFPQRVVGKQLEIARQGRAFENQEGRKVRQKRDLQGARCS